jgi:hypothetical protein
MSSSKKLEKYDLGRSPERNSGSFDQNFSIFFVGGVETVSLCVNCICFRNYRNAPAHSGTTNLLTKMIPQHVGKGGEATFSQHHAPPLTKSLFLCTMSGVNEQSDTQFICLGQRSCIEKEFIIITKLIVENEQMPLSFWQSFSVQLCVEHSLILLPEMIQKVRIVFSHVVRGDTSCLRWYDYL